MELIDNTSLQLHRTGCAAQISGQLSDDFQEKLKMTPENEHKPALQQQEEEEEEGNNPSDDDVEDHDEEEEEEEEEEFSFSSAFTFGSPISADDIFDNGQIRPVFPLFDRNLLFADGGSAESLRPPLRKVFVGERSHSSEEPEGPSCEWTPKNGGDEGGGAVAEATPETCKKSNSTGFSKLWRFRELVHRSSSDGKDAFVFLNHRSSNDDGGEKKVVEEKNKNKNKNKKKRDEATSSFSAQYGKNRAAMKEREKRRSYLPYRQDLFGFFTNVNGLSRNIHPF